jgi:hypothetical protein
MSISEFVAARLTRSHRICQCDSWFTTQAIGVLYRSLPRCAIRSEPHLRRLGPNRFSAHLGTRFSWGCFFFGIGGFAAASQACETASRCPFGLPQVMHDELRLEVPLQTSGGGNLGDGTLRVRFYSRFALHSAVSASAWPVPSRSGKYIGQVQRTRLWRASGQHQKSGIQKRSAPPRVLSFSDEHASQGSVSLLRKHAYSPYTQTPSIHGSMLDRSVRNRASIRHQFGTAMHRASSISVHKRNASVAQAFVSRRLFAHAALSTVETIVCKAYGHGSNVCAGCTLIR